MEYVKTGGIDLSLSFPPGIGFSGSDTSISRTLTEDTNVDIIGGELPAVRSEGTNVTSMERTTIGFDTVGSYTYSAASTVHFKSIF